jgi:glutathione S-transferase
MMKLFHAAASPFVRKCMVTARELGMQARIELVPTSSNPVDRNATLAASNPLGKIPTLVTDDGIVLYDSRVICEYLNALGGGQLIPPPGAARWAALVDQALGDGIADAAVLMRYENAVRPENLRWESWIAGQLKKVTAALDEIEKRATGLHGRIDVGSIAIGCALGYLDYRYASLAWRAQCPVTALWFEQFSQRDSMRATRAS